MNYIWRCQKCFRYLAHIAIDNSEVTQRTVCSRCKSENKIILCSETVVASCGFSKRYTSNLSPPKLINAPNIEFLLKEKAEKESCASVKIITKNIKIKI